MSPVKQKSVKRNGANETDQYIAELGSAKSVLKKVTSGNIGEVLESTRAGFSAARKYLTACIVATYAIAFYARTNEKAWTAICNRSEWFGFKGAHPKLDHPEEALRYVMRLSVGVETRDVLKKASSYTRALQAFFDEGVHPSEIESRINAAGGLRELEKAQAAKRSKASTSAASGLKGSVREGTPSQLPPSQLLVTIREFEIVIMRHHLEDYSGLSKDQARRMQNAVKALLRRRITELEQGGQPNAIFDEVIGAVTHLDG